MGGRRAGRLEWLMWLLGAFALVGMPSARADDFDDDFAEEPAPAPPAADAPSAAPTGPAPSAGSDFDDDFAEAPANEAGAPPPAAASAAPARAGRLEDGFDEAFSEPAAATPGASPKANRAAVDDGVADPFEDDYASRPGSLRARQMRTHNTYYGPTGGFRVVDAGGGAEDSFRFALSTELFAKNGFLTPDDHASRVGGSLSFSITPLEYLEVAASIVAYATANDNEDPTLFQVLGDTRLYLRGFGAVLPWLTLGGDIELALLNGVGDIGLAGAGTSVGLRFNASADLRNIEHKLPLVFRYNLRYYFDNSSKLISGVEDARYDNLLVPLPRADETRHLLTNAERYAFTINRVDSLSMAFGMEAPLRVKGEYYLHPVLEWVFAIPVNRQGYNCVYRPFDPLEQDSCLAETGFGTRASTLTVGARFMPPIRGLSFMTAFDIATTGSRHFVRELAPNTPWVWLNGLSYSYDLRPPRPVTITKEVGVPAPLEGRIRGHVVEEGGETPVANAVVRFQDPERSPLLTNAEGAFVSYRFPPGPVTLALESNDHHPGTCEVTLPESGEDAEANCTMSPLPRVGDVAITLRDDKGKALQGVGIRLTGGGVTHSATSDTQGQALLADLAPGAYTVVADPEGFLARRLPLEVVARDTARLDVALLRKPSQSLIRLSNERISLKRKVQFMPDASEIKRESDPLLAEIADVMHRHPEILEVEIQGHSDNTGGVDHNMRLSQERADAVRRWLIDAGVEPDRLKAVGYGPSQPLVPNITRGNRARNRRVQFEITKRGDGDGAE